MAVGVSAVSVAHLAAYRHFSILPAASSSTKGDRHDKTVFGHSGSSPISSQP